MAGPFHSFVILAGMRTGSNLLEANLNALQGVTSYGEVFNPHFVGKRNAESLFGITLAQREANPRALLEKLRSETDGLCGFRLFHDHDPRVLEIVLADPGCAKIILTRNPVDSYVSLQIARVTDQWKLADAKRLRTATAHFDETQFRAHLATTQAFQLHVLGKLQAAGQAAFILDYEDLGSLQVLNGLAAYLGISSRLRALDDSLKKQNPEPLEEKLDNPGDLEQALGRADMFALARTPIFEPRRLPPLHRAIAVDEGPLLFFPISSAPDDEITTWLSGLGPARQGFDVKSLRQWRLDHPGHRSFTVIRHPLLRAYRAFHEQIVSGRLANHRKALVRAYKAILPEPGQAFPDQESERRAFLVFLHYARLSVLGQYGQKVDPNWASQTAIIQSISTVQPLDHILREDRLETAVLQLASGRALHPTMPEASDHLRVGLDAIYDAKIESAAAAAFARDYVGFGFSRWRG